MTDTRTTHVPGCHYDRDLGYRVTARHADNCPTLHHDGDSDHGCPGRRGCEPCDHRHCVMCGREHTDHAHPQTCPECQGKVDDDLVDIRSSYAALSVEAVDGGGNGRLVAAAPIPGGDAAVLVGPTVRVLGVRYSPTIADDHRVKDAVPPLAVLAEWEDRYRAFLGHAGKSAPPKTARWGQTIAGYRRASIGGAIAYLREQLPHIAQRTDGPDFLAFTRSIRRLRAQMEHALHDEREPERGVDCFECGDELVRRFRDPKRCRHSTPARRHLFAWMHRRAAAQDWIRTLRTYPELGDVRIDELRAAAAPPARLIANARIPCDACTKAWKETQGGLDDPRHGRSWECPGCRKEYTPAEYATAVRASLLDEDGTSWCTLQAAAGAAADITGRPVSPAMIRMWISRKDDIRWCCLWTEGLQSGPQLVYWPDVLKRATEVRSRQGGRIGA